MLHEDDLRSSTLALLLQLGVFGELAEGHCENVDDTQQEGNCEEDRASSSDNALDLMLHVSFSIIQHSLIIVLLFLLLLLKSNASTTKL